LRREVNLGDSNPAVNELHSCLIIFPAIQVVLAEIMLSTNKDEAQRTTNNQTLERQNLQLNPMQPYLHRPNQKPILCPRNLLNSE